jgi:predicted aspartyl protease/Tfp pilus assembly protein PilF
LGVDHVTRLVTSTVWRTARVLSFCGAIAAALTLCLRAAPPSDDDATLQLQLGTQFFGEAKYVEALEAFDNALRTDDAALALRARKGKIRSALRIAEFSLARREAETLRTLAAADPEALSIYADSLWATGLFDESEAQYRDALAINPGSSRARLGVARSLASQTKLTEALDQGLTALAADPSDYQTHATLGDLYTRLGRFEDAALSYASYKALLAPGEGASALISQSQINFLRSFKGRTPLAVRDDVASAVHTVPFRLSKNKVLVRAEINGRYGTELVLDTGAERIGLSMETARRAGLSPVSTSVIAGVGGKGYRPLALARADSLQIGTLKIANVPVSIRNAVAGTMPRWQSETFSPVSLGWSVEVDYRRKRVTFARMLPDTSADIRLPLRVQRLPMVRGLLNSSHAAPFVIDTGGELISISTDTADALAMTPSRRIPLKVYGLSGWDEDAFLLPGVDVHFGGIEYRKLGLAVLNLRAPSVLLGFEIGGIVGYKFLGDYRVAIDLPRSELRLSRQ